MTVATNEYILHQSWNSSTLWTDIAMIKLRLPITFTGIVSLYLFYNLYFKHYRLYTTNCLRKHGIFVSRKKIRYAWMGSNFRLCVKKLYFVFSNHIFQMNPVLLMIYTLLKYQLLININAKLTMVLVYIRVWFALREITMKDFALWELLPQWLVKSWILCLRVMLVVLWYHQLW